MGVRKLNKFLTNQEIIKTYRNIQEFIQNIKTNKIKNNTHNGKIVVAIDFWLYAHKFLHSNRCDNIMLGFWNQIIKFLSYGIIPLYVMDGSVPIEKKNMIDARNNKRDSIKKKIDEIDEEIDKYVNIDDIVINESESLDALYGKRERLHKQVKRIKSSELQNIRKLFDVLGIPYVKAEYEADALCAKLYKEKIITSCLSDDMDMLALGCGSTIKYNDGQLIEFNLEQIQTELGLTQEQFIDMCILFGCDYLQHSFRLESNDIYNMINKYGSLLNVLCSNEHEQFNMNNNNVKVVGEHYYHVKEIYMNSSEKEYIPSKLYNINMQKLDTKEIIAFLKKTKMFDFLARNTRYIEHDINEINKLIENNIL